jgi:Putative auto-transporter adhesin, head GIN domain
MTRRAVPLLLALALTASLAAPVPAHAGWFTGGGTEGNGNLVTKSYDVENCDAILLRCGLDITVRFGDTQKVELTMDENLVDLYEIESRRGTLVIDADDEPRPDKRAHLEVTLRGMERLKVSGAGDIDVIKYDGKDLELVVDGAGDVEIDGKAKRVDIVINGAGDIDARHLEADDAEVSVNGAGDVSVFARKSADVSINGVGDVDVYGDPEEFAQSINGLGDIDRR